MLDTTNGLSWTGAREFEVAEKRPESSIISSFYLKPVDGDPLPGYRAGQFLTFELDVPGVAKPVIRQYSLSDGPLDNSFYRISVKREGPPPGQPDLPDGLSSCYLHDHVKVGDVLKVMAPRGQFFLDEESDRPVVLLSGGVGLTPMVSMVETIAARTPDRPTWYIHACENGDVHAFIDRISELASRHFAIKPYTCYRTPSPSDTQEKRCDSDGFITVDTLKKLLPLDNYLFYLCGPGPFMKAMYNNLLLLGVQESSIHYEFFGPATLLKDDNNVADAAEAKVVGQVDQALREQSEPAINQLSQKEGKTPPVVSFTNSDIVADWSDQCRSLLEFAESKGMQPDFSCRAGVCGSCACKIVAGEVEYFEDPLDPPEDGEILLCCSRPLTNVTIEV